jgi:hypothetical protein
MPKDPAKFRIISSMDNKFLNKEIVDTQPIILDDFEFFVYQKIRISESIWRFANSNYSIDIEVIK